MFAALCTLTAGCADDFKTVLNDKYYEDDTPSRCLLYTSDAADEL